MKKLIKKLKNLTKKHIIIISSILLVVIASIVTGVVLFTKDKENKQTTCIVQFETGGGNLLVPISTPCGSKIEKPKTPTKEGFTFINWFLLDNEFDFNSKIESDIVLTAKWEAQEGVEIVTIHFDTDGGTEIVDIEILKGTTMNMPISPIKIGYRFVNWNFNDEPFSFDTQINVDITLKANWEKLETSIYTPNMPTNPMPSGTCQYRLNSNPKTEYTFPFQEGIQLNFSGTYSPWSSFFGGCELRYKSSNPSVATIDSDGYIHTVSAGTTTLTSCIYDKESNKELYCFNATLNLQKTRPFYLEPKIPFEKIAGKWYAKYSNISYIEFRDYKKDDYSFGYTFENIDRNSFDYSCKTGTCTNYYQGIHDATTGLLGHFEEDYNMRLENNVLYLTSNGKTQDFYRTPFNVPVSNLTLDKTSERLQVGLSTLLIAFINPINATQNTVKWTNSNPSVAEITKEFTNYHTEQGFKNVASIKGLKNGTTTITATSLDGKFSKSFTLTVYGEHVPTPVESVTLNQTNLNLKREETYKLIASINPSNADNKNISWSSSNTSVATVSNGNVKAVGKGTAVITATTFDGNKTASATVNVTNPPLTAKADIGLGSGCSNTSGCYEYTFVKIIASGGSGSYTYNYTVYKDGVNVGTFTKEETRFTRQSGTYTVNYTVTDSEGQTKSGSETINISIS